MYSDSDSPIRSALRRTYMRLDDDRCSAMEVSFLSMIRYNLHLILHHAPRMSAVRVGRTTNGQRPATVRRCQRASLFLDACSARSAVPTSHFTVFCRPEVRSMMDGGLRPQP